MRVFGKLGLPAWTSAFALCLGCQAGPTQISIPTVNPGTAAAGAIELADKDGDEAISKEEAVATPSLLAVFEKYDANTDGRIDAAEIEGQIASWYAKAPMVFPVRCLVKMDGRPLMGAKVVFEPEPFLGVDLGEGVSDVGAAGDCGPSLLPERLGKIPYGMFCGLYRAKITHPSRQIPAKYNEHTELGFEVSPSLNPNDPPVLSLSSK
ncbi:hypothetical protein [Lacipirellula sp.]|uniref:hypothetical protein n=1 Tax=Lacipirellula sp. TaxID=2691419 RepID=UPI003D0C8BFB